jgi:membrane protein implicated in regulation of membrane protease activity
MESFSLSPLLVWIIAGIVMLIGEMLTASFFLLFMSLGSFAAALAAHFQQSLLIQVGIFLIVSIAGVLLLRKPIQKKLLKKVEIANDIGKSVVVDKEILPKHQENISYQGSTWSAMNIGEQKIESGSNATIVSIDGNKLLLKKN